MKKRMLGLLLALCMVLTLMPVSALADDIDTAEQASQTGAEGPSVQAQPKGIAIQAGETHTHCLCGENHKGDAYSDTNSVYHDNMTFETAWDKTTYLPSREGTYYLTTDVTLSNTAAIYGHAVTICLNGHSITYADGNALYPIGADLTITDCNKKPGYISAPKGIGIYAEWYPMGSSILPSRIYLYNISIKDCGRSAIDSNTSKDGSVFYLYNVSILNNKDGGIRTSRGSTGQDVTIINSEISDNGNYGVSITDYSHLTMINSKVKNNGNYGVYISSGSSTPSTITDSTISGNTPGLCIESNPTVIGGNTVISGNHSVGNPGGVYIRDASVTIKDNVKIIRNMSGTGSRTYPGSGGGVYLNSKVYGSELTLAGNVEITGNTDSDGNQSNLGIYHSTSKDKLMTVNSGFKGNVGIHVIGGLVPTASKPTKIDKGNYVDNFFYDGNSTQYIIKYASGYTQIQTAPYAEAPTATNVTYDGNTHQAVSGGSNWVYAGGITGSPNAGNYTVSVKPDTGMTWPDGTTTEKTYNWSIRKATPDAKYFDITAPADGTVYDGNAKTVTAALKSRYSGCGDITVSYEYRLNNVSTWQSVEEIKNAGYYQYTVTVADNGHNFDAGSFIGEFHIGHAQQTTPVTITSGDTLAYGQSMKLTAEGGTTEYPFVWILNDANGEYISSSDIASIDNDVLTALKAGTVYIRATRPGGRSGVYNYDDISSDVKTITITAGHITVKADDKTAYIGDTALPTNTHTVSGLAVGDVLSGQDTYTYYVMEGDVKTEVAPKNVDLTKAGEYIIEVSGLAADTTKYDSEITYVPGKLTVTSKPNNNTGSGSSSSDNGYKITLPASVSNGSVKSNVTMAEKGDTVTITATPAKGYVVDSLKVTDKNGSELELTDKGNGRYSFTMPGSKVTVDVTFKAEAQQNPEKTGFDDVSDSDWYSEAVDYAAEKGLMSGVGNNLFAPKADTTRGMLMTVLARYAGQDTTGGSVWYEKGMNWAKTNGVSDGTNPTASITREQLVTMLWRYAGEPAGTASLDGFNDASTVSSYAVTAMRWAVENGIINGANGSLNPRNNASRAEVAAILMRFCEMGK